MASSTATAMAPETSARSSRERKLCCCAFVGTPSHLRTNVTEAAANLPFLFSFVAEFRKKEKLKIKDSKKK
jgi:hypothetical protein